MRRRVRGIIEKIAKKHNISYDVAEAIYKSQFECAKEEIESGNPRDLDTMKSVRFVYLGVLKPDERRIAKINANNPECK